MLQLLLIVFLPKILTIEYFSNYLRAMALIGIMEITSDFGARVWAITKISQIESSSNRDTLFKALYVKVVYSTLTLGVVFSLSWLGFSLGELFLIVVIACLQPSTDPIVWYFRAKERLDVEAVITIFWRLSNVLGAILLAVIFERLTPILLWFVFNSLARICVEWHFMKNLASRSFLNYSSGNIIKKLYRTIFDTDIRSVLVACLPIGIAFFVMSFFQRMGVLYVGALSTDYAVTIFGIAFSLVASAGFMATSVTNSMYPSLVRCLENNDVKGSENNLLKQFLLISGVCLVVVFVFKVIGKYVVNILYPELGGDIYVHIGVLIVGLFPSTLNLSLKFTLNALQLNWYDVFSNVIGIVVLLCSWFLFGDVKVSLAIAYGWCLAEFAILTGKLSILNYLTDIYLVRIFSVVFVAGTLIAVLAQY